MITLTSTGVTAVDRELERRAPFPSIEAREIATAELLAVWRTLAPYSDGLDTALDRRQQRE